MLGIVRILWSNALKLEAPSLLEKIHFLLIFLSVIISNFPSDYIYAWTYVTNTNIIILWNMGNVR